jgi:hypothetical protein
MNDEGGRRTGLDFPFVVKRRLLHAASPNQDVPDRTYGQERPARGRQDGPQKLHCRPQSRFGEKAISEKLFSFQTAWLWQNAMTSEPLP